MSAERVAPTGEAAPSQIPIFALGTVLFPGGTLPLRVFETRYVDMVRERMHSAAPFGICRIKRGSEVGSVAEHESIGCLARIVDWDMQQPGVLDIRVVGGERFRVMESRIERGLPRARIELLPPDARVAPPAHLVPSVELLRHAVDQLAARAAAGEPAAIEPPFDFESAGWVANRIAELLPLPAEQRQTLMALDDPLERLARVDALVRAARGT